MKNKRLCWALVMALMCFWALGTVCLAADKEVSPYSYREELLVSYKEYWYTDGAGTESHVKYDKQYKVFTFLNGYRELSPTITQLPIDDGELPHGVTRHQEVKLNYEFY